MTQGALILTALLAASCAGQSESPGNDGDGGTSQDPDASASIDRCTALCDQYGVACPGYDAALCRSDCQDDVRFYGLMGCLEEYDALLACMRPLTTSAFVCAGADKPGLAPGTCLVEVDAFETACAGGG